jgi:hypothetical protein
MLLPFAPRPAAAKDGPRIVIQIGQPSVWSLGQAHYLLAKMHRTDKKLRTRFPTDEDLDSNKIAATRIEALRSSLGIEGQFDQAMAVKNNLALSRFREGEVRRETARGDLRARQAELQQANADLLDLNEQIAVAEEADRQSTEARGRTTPPTPPSAEDNDRKQLLARLRVRKARKEEERTELNGQVTSLRTTMDTPTPAPTLEEPALATGNGALPTSETFDSFLEKAVAEAGKPDLSASMKLDNFVQMQYEIISKQLTLLRDEVGPEDRVIFLELPASIYTVDKKADNYVAQVEWDVETVCDREPPADIQADVTRDIFLKEGMDGADADKNLMRIEKVRDAVLESKARARMSLDPQTTTRLRELGVELSRGNLSAEQQQQQLQLEERRQYAWYFEQERRRATEAGDYSGAGAPYPVTLEMIEKYIAASTNRNSKHYGEKPCMNVDKQRVRAIDVIPRLSALNVNERHAVVKQTMILAAFKFLIGFAGKVNYQRQRELYEQFVQQQVFASGYGKGDDTFGWTYGPQPGTKRISTGERTTFAVLVVPRNTLAVRLKARSRYYKMGKSPQDPDDSPTPDPSASPTPEPGMGTATDAPSGDVIKSGDVNFFLSVPGKRTQEFWVDGVSYTPVRKGRRVTAVVEGNYFSPQLGVLVNGVPLEPVLSVSRIAGNDEEADVTSADGVVGEYEVTNSRQIVMSFKMPDDYVGTPTITFTSPEKSTPLNFFRLTVNHHDDRTSLQDLSLREPMFTDEFTLGKKLEGMKVTDVCGKTINRLKAEAEADKAEAEAEKAKATAKHDAAAVAESEADIEEAAAALKKIEDTLNKIDEGKFGLARLPGTGLRPDANVLINNIGLEEINFRPTEQVCLRILDDPEEEFAMQDSTKSYLLYFKARGVKRKVAFRQPTRQGFEEESVAEDFTEPTIKVATRHYSFNPSLRRGEVDLTFTPKKGTAIDRIEFDDPLEGRCLEPRQEGDPDDGLSYRVRCYAYAANGGKLERDFITVKLTLKVTKKPKDGPERVDTVVDFEDITLPVKPVVTAVFNPRTGQPAGFADEEPTVVISGVNLQGVKSVFFGDKEAKVLAASADSVTVKVPKGSAVPKGQAAAVPVSLQGAGGQPVPSSAVYTYLGEPPTPNVIVWPYPTGKP